MQFHLQLSPGLRIRVELIRSGSDRPEKPDLDPDPTLEKQPGSDLVRSHLSFSRNIKTILLRNNIFCQSDLFPNTDPDPTRTHGPWRHCIRYCVPA